MIILEETKQATQINEETAVLIRAQNGDSQAWTHLMQQHQESAFRLAYLLLGDAAEAEDVAQEAFIRAYTHLSKLDAERPFRPWLLRIVRNLAYNQHRTVKRYLAMAQRFFQQRQLSQIESVAAQINQSDDANQLWQAVQRLKPKAQEVIYLRYFLDLSEQETAAALDIPRGTVKSRTNRAVKALKPIIEQNYPELRELL